MQTLRRSALLFSSSQTPAPSSTHCPLLYLSFYLKLSGTSGRNFSLQVYYQPTMGLWIFHVFRATTPLISWPDGSSTSAVPLLLPLLSTLLFSRTGGALSYLNSSTHRSPFHRKGWVATSTILQRTESNTFIIFYKLITLAG